METFLFWFAVMLFVLGLANQIRKAHFSKKSKKRAHRNNVTISDDGIIGTTPFLGSGIVMLDDD